MDRRQFMRLVAGSVIVIPTVGTFLVGCGGEDETPKSDDPGAAPARSGTMTVYTTNVGEAGHTHTFGIEDASYTSPPSAGVSGTTTVGEGHSHSVAVSMAQLASVATGQTVKVNTGTSDGHMHVLTLVKLGSGVTGPKDY